VERSVSWRRLNVADGDQCPPQVGCRQLGMQVSDPLATGAPDMQPWSQLVDEQETSAIEAVPACVVMSCGRITWGRTDCE